MPFKYASLCKEFLCKSFCKTHLVVIKNQFCPVDLKTFVNTCLISESLYSLNLSVFSHRYAMALYNQHICPVNNWWILNLLLVENREYCDWFIQRSTESPQQWMNKILLKCLIRSHWFWGHVSVFVHIDQSVKCRTIQFTISRVYLSHIR